jgi:hypothetical protein
MNPVPDCLKDTAGVVPPCHAGDNSTAQSAVAPNGQTSGSGPEAPIQRSTKGPHVRAARRSAGERAAAVARLCRQILYPLKTSALYSRPGKATFRVFS